jgi:hypothetical protein
MNHRDVPRAGHVLPVALLVAGAFYRPGYGQTGAGVASENPRAQVNRVLLALPQIAFPATGRGTALVMWDTAADKPADRPRFVEFAFKGPMSRADVFEFLGGRKGPWLYSHAITDRFHFGVNAGGVRISYHPQHNQLGEEFTMEALGAQEGMTVVDADSGFSHVYSPPAPIPAGWKETVEETEPTPNAPKQDSAPVPSIPDAANQQISSEPTAVTAPARVPLVGRTSALAPPPASGATAGMRRSFSSGVELTADGGQQPDGPARPTAPPADKAHAAEGDHLAASPRRVFRIHTLLGLFLLLSMFVVVEYANAHARARNRQPREL